MSSKLKDDGGPAFPIVAEGVGGLHAEFDPGMTLRDWFAGQALAGLLADDSGVRPAVLEIFGGPESNRGDAAAKYAYHIADAMLAQRCKGVAS